MMNRVLILTSTQQLIVTVSSSLSLSDYNNSNRSFPCDHVDPITACGVGCNQGQGRCFFNSSGDQCCNFYLEDECVAECPSHLMNDSNYDCGGSNYRQLYNLHNI